MSASANENDVAALRTTIDQLYHVFRRYKLPPVVNGCDHCVFEDDHRAIMSAPLRQLSAENLRRFASKAMTTWGSTEDFKHFLPRLLELLAENQDAFDMCIQTVLGKLRYGGFPNWPAAEREAVRDYLMALWRHALRRDAGEWTSDDWDLLQGIGCSGDAGAPYLEAWRDDPHPAAVRRLAGFVIDAHETMMKTGRARAAFWDAREPTGREVFLFVCDERTRQLMERAYWRDPEIQHAAEFAQAEACIAALQARERIMTDRTGDAVRRDSGDSRVAP